MALDVLSRKFSESHKFDWNFHSISNLLHWLCQSPNWNHKFQRFSDKFYFICPSRALPIRGRSSRPPRDPIVGWGSVTSPTPRAAVVEMIPVQKLSGEFVITAFFVMAVFLSAQWAAPSPALIPKSLRPPPAREGARKNIFCFYLFCLRCVQCGMLPCVFWQNWWDFF